MSAKHTPGPWFQGDHPLIEERVYAQPYSQFIAGCLTPADAKLIAAAPDLLAAAYETIYAMRDQFRITDDHKYDDDYIYDELGSKLAAAYFRTRAAIAKATGAE